MLAFRYGKWSPAPTTLWLATILIYGFLVRLAGIQYGLPLMLIADEPAFPLAALKMLELRTVIPALHPDAFAPILYYPPYLSYVYLPFYTLVLGVWYLCWPGSRNVFVSLVASDLSIFFIIARIVSLGMGVLTIYLGYRISARIFKSPTAGLFAATLLATSISHIALSSVARHWIPVTLLLLLVLDTLTHTRHSDEQRYGYTLLLIGLGTGISPIVLVFACFAAMHHALLGSTPTRSLVRNQFIQRSCIAAAGLAIIPSFLYAGGAGFVRDLSLISDKNLLGIITSPIQPLMHLFPAEPITIILGVTGLVLLLARKRTLAGFFAVCVGSYGFIFYMLFRFETRFFLPILALMSLLGGYALASLTGTRTGRTIACVCVIVLVLISGKVALLSNANDTRALAREYILRNFSADDKILVYANLTRIPTTRAAINELHALEPLALRKADEAERNLNDTTRPHALNLFALREPAFFTNVHTYAQANDYTYLLLEPSFAELILGSESDPFKILLASSTVVSAWTGIDDRGMSFSGSSFTGPITELFSGGHFGPDIVLYKLHQ